MGRVLGSRIAPPQDVQTVFEAVAQLESIPLPRFESLRFARGLKGAVLDDNVVLDLEDSTSPGMSPDRPLLINLSKIIGGVAEPVVMRDDPTTVKYTQCPTGWKLAQIVFHQGSAGFQPAEISKDVMRVGKVPLKRLSLVYVDPVSLGERYFSSA